MCDEPRPKRKPNKCYYSDEHGYVCDCLLHRDGYENLCPMCQQKEDEKEEDNDDDT